MVNPRSPSYSPELSKTTRQDMSATEPVGDADSLGSRFPELLRRRREAAGLSQNGLAEAAGRDAGTINRLESGKRAPVNRELVEDLSRALGLSEQGHDEFLAAAGHLPDVYRRVGLGDPDLRLVADLLGDERLSAFERRDLRLAIRVVARRWRATGLADLLDGEIDLDELDVPSARPDEDDEEVAF